MDDSAFLLGSFLLFMLFFAGVGLASMRVKEDTTDDYLVAGRGMHPALAALSAVSTWNSGYMFIGFIGFIFINGYSAIWIAVVSTIGQLVAWIWLYKYIQKEGETRGIRSLSSLVSNTTGSPEAKVAAVLSVIFLSIYAAAQLTAGGIALETMLKWSPTIGILIGFVLVVAYCYAGGIRASIWTDAAQSCVMIVGSTILCYVAIKESGGFSGLHDQLNSIEPAMVSLFPSGLKFGATSLDRSLLPRWPRRCWPTTSCLTCNDAQGRQGSKASNGLVLRLADSFHHPDVPHWIDMPRLIAGTWHRWC